LAVPRQQYHTEPYPTLPRRNTLNTTQPKRTPSSGSGGSRTLHDGNRSSRTRRLPTAISLPQRSVAYPAAPFPAEHVLGVPYKTGTELTRREQSRPRCTAPPPTTPRLTAPRLEVDEVGVEPTSGVSGVMSPRLRGGVCHSSLSRQVSPNPKPNPCLGGLCLLHLTATYPSQVYLTTQNTGPPYGTATKNAPAYSTYACPATGHLSGLVPSLAFLTLPRHIKPILTHPNHVLTRPTQTTTDQGQTKQNLCVACPTPKPAVPDQTQLGPDTAIQRHNPPRPNLSLPRQTHPYGTLALVSIPSKALSEHA
jgi:hypothetical protein